LEQKVRRKLASATGWKNNKKKQKYQKKIFNNLKEYTTCCQNKIEIK